MPFSRTAASRTVAPLATIAAPLATLGVVAGDADGDAAGDAAGDDRGRR
jgi:hypothetical protein